jgi:hypothetical protein
VRTAFTIAALTLREASRRLLPTDEFGRASGRDRVLVFV